MNGGNARLGWGLIIAFACCRVLDLWLVSWDKAVFVAWGMVLEQ